MTSHVRHRRSNIPADPFVAPMETGELAVNTANRQIAAGAPGGQPIALIAVRYFDTGAQYAKDDFVAQGGFLWVARAPIPPGPFVEAQWNKASSDPVDPTDLSAYLQKTGGTMSGPLVLHANPAQNMEAATKLYVDNATPPPPPTPTAIDIAFTPGGTVQASNVQSAIAEVASEKVAKAGDTMTGHLVLPASPGATNAVRKDYVDAADTAVNNNANSKVSKAGDTMQGTLTVNGDIYAQRNATTGVLYLGSNGGHYLYFDGATYNLPSGGLSVGGIMTSAGANINGVLNANQASNFAQNQAHTINTNGYFGAGAPANFMLNGGPYPTIAFHAAGYFGANFGMNTDGNFYIGGWSFGAGVYYKVLTTRDGAPVTSHRMVYVGDWQSYTGYQDVNEPYGGSSITGITGIFTQDGTNFYQTSRFRQHQLLINGGWYAVGYA